MTTSKSRRGAAIIITRGTVLLDENANPLAPVGSVRRRDVAGLFGGEVLGAGAVVAVHATAVGLPEQPPQSANSVPDIAANGQVVLAAVRRAIADPEGRGRLRKLCAWFPCVLRMPEVHACLDGLPREDAEQIAGIRRGRGSPPKDAELIGLVATMERLINERNMTARRAAREVAKVNGVGASEDRLRNMHSELGELVCCLAGYRIAESAVPLLRWGERSDDELLVYVKR